MYSSSLDFLSFNFNETESATVQDMEIYARAAGRGGLLVELLDEGRTVDQMT